MNFMSKVLNRIDTNPNIILDCDIDTYARKGMRAKVDGVLKKDEMWKVQLYMKNSLGTIEEITLLQYMNHTKDIK